MTQPIDNSPQEIKHKCEYCENEGTQEYKQKWYCELCFSDNFSTCEDCRNTFHNDDIYRLRGVDVSVCERCRDNHYACCDCCGDWVNNDYINEFRGNYYCDGCLDDKTSCCDNCGDRHLNDDLYFEDDNCLCQDCHDNEEQAQEIKLNFEKIKSNNFKMNKHKNFCGIELETLNDNLKENAFKNYDELKNYGFSQVFDSSLGNEGLEYVSLAYNGDKLLNRIKRFSDELKKRNFYINTDCGYHLHIAIKKDLEYLKKIFYFYLKYEKHFFRMVSNSRQNSTYCKKLNDLFKFEDIKSIQDLLQFQMLLYDTKNKRYVNSYKKEKYNNKRYYWVNFHSVFYRGTLEIRLHNGTIDSEKINNWIKIHLRVLDFIKHLNIDTINKLPDDDDFFLSLFDENLKSYIVKRWDKFKDRTKEEKLNEEE